MDLKELDEKLREVVEKWINALPDFNTGHETTDMLKRVKYASENISFNNEINKIADEYLSDKENLSLRDKENFWFLLRRYRTKYEYGFNFPGGDDFYQSLF
ncbi:hypothetical protein LRR18_16640 [Mangrovimonas sp. AS39]|uniref:hypothetical protein n=1 Tax=Mangrovimonas futianensis TaxID=2895523 RepID=UPI001E565802|nr:hypothetical protein [Mangrovimonas futianensis]MCF1193219.1 hypothetical protein [Mangrovimonas futianensis]MCF1196839.1 hypothetical protein [Mangrovimonas futianensis]MCF1423245.1 hypothetical protein [Mangrovimonas futianensis]